MEHFVAGTTARCAAGLVDVNFKTATYYYHRLRMLICLATESETAFAGEIEVDESYFGGHRKGKRGRGAAGKVPVFGILKRGGKVYTKVITDTKAKTLMGIMCKNKLNQTASYIPITTVLITYWMYQSLNIIELITLNSLPTSKTILMELKTFGTRPSVICGNLMVFLSLTFLYF